MNDCPLIQRRFADVSDLNYDRLNLDILPLDLLNY